MQKDFKERLMNANTSQEIKQLAWEYVKYMEEQEYKEDFSPPILHIFKVENN